MKNEDMLKNKKARFIRWARVGPLSTQVYEYIDRLNPGFRRDLRNYYNSMRLTFLDDAGMAELNGIQVVRLDDTNKKLSSENCSLIPLAFQSQTSPRQAPGCNDPC